MATDSAGAAPQLNLNTAGKAEGFESQGNRELMAEARQSLSGNWGVAVLGYLLYGILIGCFYFFIFAAAFFVGFISKAKGVDPQVAVQYINIATQLIAFFTSGALILGFNAFFLGIASEGEAQLDLLFTGFRRYFRAFVVYFLMGIFVFLWTLLLYIPGIIAIYRYSMAYFVLADDEDCGALEAIARSKQMMKGNKWKLFCLQWRFLGWGILCTLIPIGWIWLVPYMQTSFAQFYEDVR